MRIGSMAVVIRADSDRERRTTWRLGFVADSSFGVQIEYRWNYSGGRMDNGCMIRPKRKRDGMEKPAVSDRDRRANGRVDEGGEKAGGRLSVQQAMMVVVVLR